MARTNANPRSDGEQARLDGLLLDYIDNSLPNEARAVLQQGADPNGHASSKGILVSALTMALLRRWPVDFIECLLAHGADPNGHGAADYRQPILVAVQQGDVAMAQTLIERGASLAPSHDIGGPFLIWEAAANSSEPVACAMIDVLVKGGLPIDQLHPHSTRKGSYETVVHLCCERNLRERVLEHLLQRGADPDGGGRLQSPAWRAVRMGNGPALAVLHAHGADLNSGGHGTPTPLCAAFAPFRYQMMKALLGMGANPDLSAPGTPSPLRMAVQEGRLEAVDMLLNAGADPGRGAGYPLEAQARARGHDAVAQLLQSCRERDEIQAQTPNAAARASFPRL